MRLGSAGEPFRWYISHPPHSGPSIFQSLRLPSAVRTNAPLRVPTSTRTPLIHVLLGRPQRTTSRRRETHRSLWRISAGEHANGAITAFSRGYRAIDRLVS